MLFMNEGMLDYNGRCRCTYLVVAVVITIQANTSPSSSCFLPIINLTSSLRLSFLPLSLSSRSLLHLCSSPSHLGTGPQITDLAFISNAGINLLHSSLFIFHSLANHSTIYYLHHHNQFAIVYTIIVSPNILSIHTFFSPLYYSSNAHHL